MNWASLRRKTVLPPVLAAAVVLGGCASHYPYDTHDGVYYGKSYDRHGHYYPYGHSSYGYGSYRVYDYRRSYWYRPYGYGYYGRYWRDDDDHHHRRDVDHGGEDRASDELRRITRDQDRVRLDAPGNHPPRLHREKSETTVGASPAPRDSGARGQLRNNRTRPADPPRPTPSPAPRGRTETRASDGHHEGGIVTPRDRRR